MNKYGKFIVHSFILFVLLFSVAAISAADLNGTDDNGMDVLKDKGTAESSIITLNYEVEDAGSSFDLVNDYKYNDLTDQSCVDGVLVDKKNFVINGNNHVIDCGNNARAFNLTGGNVVINNLIIKNAKYPSGSAISTKSNLTLNNVTFINCSGNVTDDCGAIVASGVLLNINNCNFIDNSAGEGASIAAYGSAVEVVNSTFASSSDNIIKGQIYIYKSDLIISNSTFLNTTSRYATAVFAEADCRIVISQSKFKNLFASKTAGAIGVKQISDLAVTECEFYNVSSANNGGAIFADINGDKRGQDGNVMIINTTFDECRSGFGGAILQLAGNLIVNGSKFTSNVAEYEGGAIYTSYAIVEIMDSKFRYNTVSDVQSYGGACYFDMGMVTLEENIFENNLGLNVSTIYAYDVDLTLERNYFENPSNVTSIYTVYGKVEVIGNNFTDDVCSFNNTNDFYNFEDSTSPFIIVNNTLSFDEIPEKFDLRDYGWVTPVKNQGFMGACWAFGNLAALESSLLRYTNVTYSLSVNNMQNSLLQYSKYGRVTSVEGGRYYSAVAYLIDWLGIFPEEYDGYDELGKISSLYITPDNLHITNVVVIPERKNAQDNDLIKNALINYGAVSVSHNADFDEEKYFNPVYSAQYYNGKESANHLVCIVGWDDNYSRGNFNPLNRPEGDGAWIVKNSWGTDWGDGGYFYVSYYDTSIANVPSVAYIINNDTYNRIYQINVGGIGEWSSNAKYYANKFVADEDELIAAVGTFFEDTGSEYELMVAVNGVDVYSQKGVSKFGGYETIKLDKYVQIKKGDSFTIGFKNKLFFADLLRIHLQKNQSFASVDGKVWEDLANNGVVAIVKAYTVSDINITENLVKYYNNETTFVAHVGANETVIFEFNDENHTVVADENGLAKLEIDCDVGEYPITTTYNNISIVSYVVVKSTIISSDVTRGYNSNYNYKLQVMDASGNPLNNTKVAISINNGKFSYYTSDNSGYITVPFKKLTKQQTITVINPKTGDNRQTKIVVKSRFSGASNVAMYYFDGSKFKARIVGDDGNFVGKNQVVTIKLNKKTYKVKTDAKGYATLKIPSTVKPGSYKLTATYKGQTIKKTIKVKQNLKTSKYTVKKSAKKLTVKATLKNGKTPLKNKKITLKINGKKITAKTNKKGIAKFTIKKNVINKLKVGKKYTMQVTYLKNTVKTTLKVKR
ncbi:MAG: hypothetical protein IJ287_00740 [Methanobrevibacter sp.]|nr:hypothetical protein [Methanobrevibacter sp.]